MDARDLNSGFHTSLAGALSINPFCSKDILTFFAGTTILLNTEDLTVTKIYLPLFSYFTSLYNLLFINAIDKNYYEDILRQNNMPFAQIRG